jgi:hypothetical protein
MRHIQIPDDRAYQTQVVALLSKRRCTTQTIEKEAFGNVVTRACQRQAGATPIQQKSLTMQTVQKKTFGDVVTRTCQRQAAIQAMSRSHAYSTKVADDADSYRRKRSETW